MPRRWNRKRRRHKVRYICLIGNRSLIDSSLPSSPLTAVPLFEEKMGAENASSSLQYEEDDNSSKNNSSFVVLNVYDLTPMNNYIYWFGLGIFHSGIEGTYFSPSCSSHFWYVSTCKNAPSSKRESLFRSEY